MAERKRCPECGEFERNDHMWGCPKRSKSSGRLPQQEPASTDAPAEEPAVDLEALRKEAEQAVARKRYEEAQAALSRIRAAKPGLARAAWFMALEEAIEFSGAPLTVHAGGGEGAAAEAAPPPSKELTPGRVVGWLVVLLVGGLAGVSLLTASMRRLHIVNGTPWEATVRVGDKEVRVPTQSHVAFAVGEGTHNVEVRHAGSTQSVTIDMQTGFFQRLGDTNSAFVLNVDGAAALVWREGIYSDLPTTNVQPRPPSVTFGRVFSTFHKVNYVFQPLPDRTTVKRSRQTDKRLNQLTFLKGPPSVVVTRFPPDTSVGTLLEFLELHLRLDPKNAKTRAVYRDLGFARGGRTRVEAFLKGLGP